MASLANWEYMDRLSGAPFDTVNPNGLAFIIDSMLPFVYFMALVSWRWAIPLLLLLPVLIYALVLTASRTGFIGMLVVIVGIWLKSEKKALLLCVFAAMFAAVLPFISAEQKDRYLSIFRSDTKNAATADGRIEGVSESLRVAMRRPLFGHGLGTSREVNANYAQSDQPAHNLYAEIAQEIGLIGLLIFLLYIKSTVKNFSKSMKSLKNISSENLFLTNAGQAMQVWFFMNLLFSFASYGLSSYEWYLLPGLSVVISRLTIASAAVRLTPSESIRKRKYVIHS
jgi:O-antigen ligase